MSTKCSSITVSDRALSEGCVGILGNLIVRVYATVTQISLSSLQEENSEWCDNIIYNNYLKPVTKKLPRN